ncbi:heparan sulfate glucosamine 3-O-sulfotransferase 1-like [Acanthaster planci]|uniref:Heparan sulfate glucosamine 3-O-sulfotransferase 1-like n=1 Tax=Acanthaster planci TaxID=133434 RepID=A0A8B7XRP0_ACAPL|nr:heparan sulfate glucosamine 3-O-sulfotransferase 1-like [Acanthaster planci]
MKYAETSFRGRWKKRAVWFAVVCLLLTFWILGRRYPTGNSIANTLSWPSDGYQLAVHKLTYSSKKNHPDRHKPMKKESWMEEDSVPRENATCDKCCYRYTTIDKGLVKIRSKSDLRKRGCSKRFPDAIIFGVKKGGTTTLKNFLSYHPDIAFTQREVQFFTSTEERSKGLEYYRSRMIQSIPDQITMEKSPAYFQYRGIPALIRKALPRVKLITIMRDPVQRAISDYVHMRVTMAKKCNLTSSIAPDAKCQVDSANYFIGNTFEESVINSSGEVSRTNLLVAKGVYVTVLRGYLMYFHPKQILAIDGEAFINDPYPAVKRVEQFLGIRDYFTPDHFYFEAQKGFFCLNKPIPRNCMREAKGRPHPDVDDATLLKLRDFYRPYNKALNQLMKVDFRWSS